MSEFDQIHHSRYGGLWTDRKDSLEILATRLKSGEIDQDQEFLLRHWIQHGYVILEGAIDSKLCSELARELANIFEFGSDTTLFQDPEAPPGIAQTVPPGLPAERMRLVDMYGASQLAADVLMSPKITNFLHTIFDTSPLCFQGLTFEQGSGQGLHQDTAYVVIDRPLELAAAWIALEDIQENSGELMYVTGSHRLPDWNFGGDSKHWDPQLHGQESHSEWSKWLIRKSEELGLEKKIFRPKKGDVLIWSADLVHGGSPVGDKSLSRRSIVGHYCPVERTPHYFNYLPHRAIKVPYKNGFFSSSYYSLNNTSLVRPQKALSKLRSFFSKN
jgi:phytanoyl-CoA hydroxylase